MSSLQLQDFIHLPLEHTMGSQSPGEHQCSVHQQVLCVTTYVLGDTLQGQARVAAKTSLKVKV